MSLYSRGVYVCALAIAMIAGQAMPAAAAMATVKVAFWNVMSGKGVDALAGHPTPFSNTPNCTDPTQPMNAWGVGAMQAVLTQTLSDPSVVALGVAEAWNCATPEKIRKELGWKEQTGEQNGLAIVARYGFAAPAQWQQLDTTLNTNPLDTMWVVRALVCLDAACTQSMPVYAAHWYATSANSAKEFPIQAQQTLGFLNATSGGVPHILVGDLNVFEGTSPACNQLPNNNSLPILRDGGYRDAWVTIHGGAEGYTGMANRTGCGVPEGYTWKRIDYAWTPAAFQPLDIQRFGMMVPGDASPSDHYGIIATLPYPGTASSQPQDPSTIIQPPSGSPTTTPAPDDIVLYAKNATAVTGAWSRVDDATAAGGVRLANPDAGAAKLAAAAAAPASYFELPFTAEAGRAYRLWIRGKAENDSWQNDSAFAQFSGSVDATGAPAFRIGTTAATVVSIEEASGAGLSGWGWQDNGYGMPGPLLYFDGTPQTLRVQLREDGLSIDQIVLSPVTYATTAPGAAKNDTTILALPAPPVSANGDVILYAKNATAMSGAWSRVTDTTAAGGVRVANPDAGAAKLTAAAASPASYFELPFVAEKGRAYRLWIRGKAENDSWQNDSTFVQFSGSLDASGAPAFRIGTTTATVVSIEEASGAGLSGWGWQDNGYGMLGPLLYFDGTPQTLRVQVREDGLSIDQIVLSPVTYATTAPGAGKNDTTILPLPTATTTVTTTTTTTPTTVAPAPVTDPAAAPPTTTDTVTSPATTTTTATTGDIVLYAKNAAITGAWTRVNDATAAGGVRLANPDAGVAKLAAAAVSPASYFELPFTAEAGRAYRLWIRGKAQNDSWQNDSTFVQFSGSLDATGAPAFRIGTTAATVVSIEDASGAGVSGWGWQDNGYGTAVLGPAIYFDGTPQMLRVQVREDGLSIDQIVLSPVTYATVAPGAGKNDTTVLAETAAAAQPAPTPAPAPVPAPTPAPVTSSTLRLLQWNTHHGGYGTDNVYSPDRVATWVAAMNPDVVMFNEIERFTSWGNQNQPEVYKNLLQQKTGKTWYYVFAQEYGQWTANGKGNMILSTVPFESTNLYELVNNGDRSIGSAVITWNGRHITLMSTHLDPYSATLRLTQAQEVTTWAAPQPENRILTGDMNAWPDQTSIAHLDTLYNDSWSVAYGQGTAMAFAGNDGQTKNGRIDYIFYSKASTDLSVVSSQVYDTRDANGVMPSDHRPVLTTFSIR
jgi:endonuclease/exonuclease/phosphatase family metal-dependent hydrolase